MFFLVKYKLLVFVFMGEGLGWFFSVIIFMMMILLKGELCILNVNCFDKWYMFLYIYCSCDYSFSDYWLIDFVVLCSLNLLSLFYLLSLLWKVSNFIVFIFLVVLILLMVLLMFFYLLVKFKFWIMSIFLLVKSFLSFFWFLMEYYEF